MGDGNVARHNPADSSGSAVDWSASNLGVQQQLGLLPERRAGIGGVGSDRSLACGKDLKQG